MVIIRNDKYVQSRRQLGMALSFISMGVLLGGMFILFTDRLDLYIFAILSLPFGWMLSQVGLYFSHRFVRTPRPDQRLDEELEGVVKDGRLYHYVLPVSHVLLTPAGPIVLIPKYQGGNISVEGERWKQTGLGFSRVFGQESVGNPTREAEMAVKQLARFISQNVPSLADKELPIGALIVFTTKHGGQLELQNSSIPAMHYSKLKGFWKQRTKDKPLPAEEYQALLKAFEEAAGLNK